MTDALIEAQLLRLVSEYQDMNGTQVVALDRPPTALEFSQMVALSRPVVFKSDASVPDAGRWTAEYLAEALGEREVSVSVTPDGNADSLHEAPVEDGSMQTFFVEPHNVSMTLRELLRRLEESTEPENLASDEPQEVLYLQSQNGNVYSPYDDAPEFAALQADIPATLPWASEALGQEPDAVNLWIGSATSKTALHKDPYENVYAVVSGVKTFRVLPPVEGVLLGTRLYPHATWTRPTSSSAAGDGGKPAPLKLTPSPASTPRVPWTAFDPSSPPGPPSSASDRTHLAQPLTIAVPEGYSLYLPAMWYHHVSQAPPPAPGRRHEPCIALNWWFDQSYVGERAVVRQFVEGMARAVGWIDDGWQADDDSSDEDDGPTTAPPAAQPPAVSPVADAPAIAAPVVERPTEVDDAGADGDGHDPAALAEEEDDEEEARRGRDLVASLMCEGEPSDLEDDTDGDV